MDVYHRLINSIITHLTKPQRPRDAQRCRAILTSHPVCVSRNSALPNQIGQISRHPIQATQAKYHKCQASKANHPKAAKANPVNRRAIYANYRSQPAQAPPSCPPKRACMILNASRKLVACQFNFFLHTESDCLRGNGLRELQQFYVRHYRNSRSSVGLAGNTVARSHIFSGAIPSPRPPVHVSRKGGRPEWLTMEPLCAASAKARGRCCAKPRCAARNLRRAE